MTTEYTMRIFDANPNEVDGGFGWPSHDGMIVEADGDKDAIAEALSILEDAAEGLSVEDGYEVGQRLYAPVYRDGSCVGTAVYVLTADDLDS